MLSIRKVDTMFDGFFDELDQDDIIEYAIFEDVTGDGDDGDDDKDDKDDNDSD